MPLSTRKHPDNLKIANQLGSFQENFDFSVDGTDQDLKISICGEVIGPTFRFEPPLVEFGTVSLGFEESKNCRIINTSLVPMEFELELTESASLNKVGISFWKTSYHRPQPYFFFQATLQMEPSHGCLEPESEKEVKLIFKADLESSYNVVLSINIPGVGKSILQVPVRAISKVPQIQMTPDEIDLGRIFLNYEMNSNVTLFNPSKTLRAVYNLSSFQNGQMTIDFDSPQGNGLRRQRLRNTHFINGVMAQF